MFHLNHYVQSDEVFLFVDQLVQRALRIHACFFIWIWFFWLRFWNYIRFLQKWLLLWARAGSTWLAGARTDHRRWERRFFLFWFLTALNFKHFPWKSFEFSGFNKTFFLVVPIFIQPYFAFLINMRQQIASFLSLFHFSIWLLVRHCQGLSLSVNSKLRISGLAILVVVCLISHF